MVIETRTLVGASAAGAVVGAALWVCLLTMDPPAQAGSVEIQQLSERSWDVQVRDLNIVTAPNEIVQTAANR